MIHNSDITVINEIDGALYFRYISGISFICKSAKTVSEKGLLSADFITIRIPVSPETEQYVDKSLMILEITTEDNNLLTLEGSYWTIAPQKTLIVEGSLSDEEKTLSLSTLIKARKVYTVTSFKDNRIKGSGIKHWRCDCQ